MANHVFRVSNLLNIWIPLLTGGRCLSIQRANCVQQISKVLFEHLRLLLYNTIHLSLQNDLFHCQICCHGTVILPVMSGIISLVKQITFMFSLLVPLTSFYCGITYNWNLRFSISPPPFKLWFTSDLLLSHFTLCCLGGLLLVFLLAAILLFPTLHSRWVGRQDMPAM